TTAEKVYEKVPRPVKSPTRNYLLPATLSADTKGKIKELRLLYSMDKGKTWKVFEQTSEEKQTFIFQAPRDGLYWLILQVEFKDGTIVPKDPKASPPHQIVEVTTTREADVKKAEVQEEKIRRIFDFIVQYHRKPEPNRVPEILDLMIKENLFDGPSLANDSLMRAVIAHGLGHMARGQPKLVRLFEAHFTKAKTAGREFMLLSLMVCGDEKTSMKMEKWQKDPANFELRYSL